MYPGKEFLLFLLMLISKIKKRETIVKRPYSNEGICYTHSKLGRRVKNNLQKILNDEIYNAVILHGKRNL